MENKKKFNSDNGEDQSDDQFKDGRSKDQDVELIFKPVPCTKDEVGSNFLQIRYIKTTINATIDHLVKYISMRHVLDCKTNNTQNNNELMKDVSNEESLFTIYQAVGPGKKRSLTE